MKDQEALIYVARNNKQSRFDKRLILKVVSEIEKGLPRKEAIQTYGLSVPTLDSWMRNYGSQDYQEIK